MAASVRAREQVKLLQNSSICAGGHSNRGKRNSPAEWSGRERERLFEQKGLELKPKDKIDGKSHRREQSDLISRGFPESRRPLGSKVLVQTQELQYRPLSRTDESANLGRSGSCDVSLYQGMKNLSFLDLSKSYDA